MSSGLLATGIMNYTYKEKINQKRYNSINLQDMTDVYFLVTTIVSGIHQL